jgi:hypothetical protein
MGTITNSHKALVGKAEGEKPFGRPRRRRKNNIKMGIKETRQDVD